MDGVCSTYGREQKYVQGFGGETVGKGPLGRNRRRWEYNIKMDLQEVGCGSMDWIELAQDRDRLAGNCECGNESSGSIKCR